SRSGLTRYELLETVRQFAAERLADSGERGRLAHRHAAHYVALAQRAEPHERGPQHLEWLDRLEADHDNLRIALGWCLENDAGSALWLASSLTWFWITHGYFSLGQGWLDAALAATTDETPARAYG